MVSLMLQARIVERFEWETGHNPDNRRKQRKQKRRAASGCLRLEVDRDEQTHDGPTAGYQGTDVLKWTPKGCIVGM